MRSAGEGMAGSFRGGRGERSATARPCVAGGALRPFQPLGAGGAHPDREEADVPQTAHRPDVADHLREVQRGYDDEIRPIESYAPLVLAFNALFGGFLVAYARSGRKLPETIPPSDVILLATATHKLSRI